ncbi:MAG: BON domain-containing protein [Gammaproteobacteria bacterium]|nr:BON domain-containing protein [Gammaproteobacteria bacterium]
MRQMLIISLCTLGLTGCFGNFFTDEKQPMTLHSDRRTSGDMLMDTALELQIQERLHALQLPEQHRVYVKTFNRHVLLLGQVENRDLIQDISNLVEQTEGIHHVYNELTNGRSLTYWQQTKDSWITTKISSSMMVSPHIGLWKIHVLTENSVVYLFGIVTAEEEALAIEIARKTYGVRKVVTLFDRVETEAMTQTS